MLQKIGLADEVTLRKEVRALYREKGLTTCLQCVYEMCVAAQIFMEVLKEELEQDKK